MSAQKHSYHGGKPRVGFVPVTMKLFWELYPELEEKTLERSRYVQSRLGEACEVVASELVGDCTEADEVGRFLAEKQVDVLVIWANGYVSSDISVQIIDHLQDVPVLLLITQRDKTIPAGMDYSRYMENTALTSMTELGGALAKSGKSYDTIVGHDADDVVYDKVRNYAQASRVLGGLRSLNICSVGYPYPGMLDIVLDERVVNQIGPKVTHISLPEIKRLYEEAPEQRVAKFVEDTKGLYVTKHVKHDDVLREARLYCVLEDLVEQQGFGAICLHDYECVSAMTKAISDFALSMIENQKGIATGVEGDMPNTISAYILSHLTGKSVMFVDWTMFDEELNAVFFQHNGKADPAMVNEAVLKPTAEPFGIIGDGAVFEVMGRPGPVTMMSMIYDQTGWRLFVAEGEALQADAWPCRLNQMLVKIDQPVREYLEKVTNLGLTHHVNISHGHVQAQAQCLAKMMGIECVSV